MDLDVGCLRHRDLQDLITSMSEQPNKVAMFPLTQPIGLSNDIMFATKSSPFFQDLTAALQVKNKWYGLPYLTVMYSTGPMFLSLQYMRSSPAKQEEVLVLAPELYTKRGTRYFQHFEGSTWHRSNAHLVQWIMRHKSILAVILLVPCIVCLPLTRSLAAVVASSIFERTSLKQENKIV